MYLLQFAYPIDDSPFDPIEGLIIFWFFSPVFGALILGAGRQKYYWNYILAALCFLYFIIPIILFYF